MLIATACLSPFIQSTSSCYTPGMGRSGVKDDRTKLNRPHKLRTVCEFQNTLFCVEHSPESHDFVFSCLNIAICGIVRWATVSRARSRNTGIHKFRIQLNPQSYGYLLLTCWWGVDGFNHESTVHISKMICLFRGLDGCCTYVSAKLLRCWCLRNLLGILYVR